MAFHGLFSYFFGCHGGFSWKIHHGDTVFFEPPRRPLGRVDGIVPKARCEVRGTVELSEVRCVQNDGTPDNYQAGPPNAISWST